MVKSKTKKKTDIKKKTAGKKAVSKKKTMKSKEKTVKIKKTTKKGKKGKKTVEKPMPEPEVKETVSEEPVVEQRVLKKLPPATPKNIGTQLFRVFGHVVSASKIKTAAREAYSKRTYNIDDIHVDNYIKEAEWDNLITKIGLLDRIEEQLNLMYPEIDVERPNKITIELYAKE